MQSMRPCAPTCRQVALTRAANTHQQCRCCRFPASKKSSSLASAAGLSRARRNLWCSCAIADIQLFETGAKQAAEVSSTSHEIGRRLRPHKHRRRTSNTKPPVQPLSVHDMQTRSAGKLIDTSSSEPCQGDIKQVKSSMDAALKQKNPGMCHQALQVLESAASASGAEEILSAMSEPEQRSFFSHIQHIGPQTVRGVNAAQLDGQKHHNQAKKRTPALRKQTRTSQHELKAALVNHLESLSTFGRVSVILGDARMTVLKLFLSHRKDWAEEFLLKLPANLPCTSYQSFVSSCVEHDSFTGLKTVMKAMDGTGCCLSKSATMKAMTLCEAQGDVDSALSLFELAVQKGKADTDVFSKAMAACLAAGRSTEAFAIYNRLKASGLGLSLHSYHTAFTGGAHLKAQGLQQLYAEMMAQENLVLKDKTFGFVFRAAANCGEHLPASWIIQVLADMSSSSIQINSHIFAAFLQAITAVPLHPDQVEAVFGGMAAYRACQPPSAFVYSALLTFCARHAPERALDVWHALQEDGLPLTSYLFSTMFAACAAAGTPEMLEAADSSHMQLEGLWNKICSQGKAAGEERDMLRAHNALLHVYATHGQTHKAKQLYASMQERGPATDRVSASTLIAAFAKSADKKAALQVFDQMRARKMQPTSQCYTSLLAACARAGDLAAARRVFSDMHVPPSVEAYTALMDACLKQSSAAVAASAAFQVFAEMKGKGLKPSGTTYGCLLMVCARCNDVDRAFQLFEEAYAAGVLQGDECHNILVGICSDAGRVDDALNLVKSLASKHGAMQQTTLNSLIRSLLNVNQAPRALRMLSIMLNMGLKPYRTTIDALIAGCARDSNSMEAARFYWGLREHGGEASKASSSELIISLCKAGERMGALRVYQDMTFSPAPQPPPQHRWTPPAKAKRGKKGKLHAKQQEQDAAAAETMADSLQIGTATASSSASAAAGLATVNRQDAGAVDTTPGSSTDPAQPSASNSSASPGSVAIRADRTPTTAQALSLGGDSTKLVSSSHRSRQSVPTGQVAGSRQDAALRSQADPAVAPASVQESTHMQGRIANNRSHREPEVQSSLMQRPSRASPQEVPASSQDQAQPVTRAASTPSSNSNNSHSRHSMSSAAASSSTHSAVTQQSDSGQAQAILDKPRSLPGRTAEAAATGSNSSGLLTSLRLSQKGAPVFPSTAATAALVHAFASADDLEQCRRLYKQLQRDKKNLPGLTRTNRKMWESIIEAASRAGDTEWALQVFDDWKACSMSSMFVLQQPSDQTQPARFPYLSNATLAFLEACCRNSPQHEWRVFDVCAVMRQQRERKQEAALARPAKPSHHVAEYSGSPNSQE